MGCATQSKRLFLRVIPYLKWQTNCLCQRGCPMSLNWLPVSEITLCLVHKIKSGRAPYYLDEYFVPRSPVNDRCTRSRLPTHSPEVSTTNYTFCDTGAGSFDRKSVAFHDPPSKPFFIINATSVIDVANIIQNNTLKISCNSISNPTSSYTWNGPNISNRKEQILRIKITHKNDDGQYSCTAANKMVRSDNTYRDGINTSDVNVKMLYPPKQLNCRYGNKNGAKISNNSLNVIKGDSFSIYCDADGYPAPDFKWDNLTNGRTLNVIAITSDAKRTGTATNRMNETGGEIRLGSNSATISISVLCPPRPSSDANSDGTVTTTLHADVTLTFTAHDYLDEPDKTIFKWFKDNASIEDNVSKFAISSYGLQSNLSFRNVTETDFGQYRVRAKNSVGNYLHIYALQAKDKPDVPKVFSYIKDSITDSSVTVKWVPGFNGGYRQNFILLYKRITESNWQNKSIRDTGERQLNYTLLSLFSKNEYQVQMFARNEEGDSAYTDVLQFSTKEQTSEHTEADTGNISGIVAGTMSSLAIVVIVVLVIGVYLFRKRSKQKESQKVYYDTQRNTARVANESSLTYETLNDSKRERDLYSQLPATYEQLDAASRERNAYSEIENTEHDMSDYVNMRI